MKTVTLYTKPGCHLCDAVEQVIAQVRRRREFELVIRNIESDPVLFERFRHEIPVVELDGVEIARYRLTIEALENALEKEAPIALVVMAKHPTPGRVKTRLQMELTPEQAACVQKTLLHYTVEAVHETQLGQVIVCCDPPEMVEAMKECFIQARRRQWRWMPQSGGDLGARLASAAVEALRRHERVVFLGVDAPDLPPGHLRAAAEATAGHDVVLGPTSDGGFWCLGLRRGTDASALLQEIEWSSGRELAQTMARAGALNYTVFEAPPWQDVDHPSDLRALLRRCEQRGPTRTGEMYYVLQKVLPPGFFV